MQRGNRADRKESRAGRKARQTRKVKQTMITSAFTVDKRRFFCHIFTKKSEKIMHIA